MDDAVPVFWDLTNDPEMLNLSGYITSVAQSRYAPQAQAPLGALPSSSNENDADGTFVRFEDKYFLSRASQEALEKLLLAHSAPSYIGNGIDYNLIESIYFDSENLDIYRNHFAELPRRIKLRSRRYGPNGVWKGKSSHLELKAKENGICRKERFKIGRKALEKLSQGESVELTPKLIDKNSSIGIQTLRRRVRDVNEAVSSYRLHPRLRVTYRRKSYEKDGFRVTFDDGIRSELLAPISPELAESMKSSASWTQAKAMHAAFASGGGNILVLELKHAGSIPPWMRDFLKEHTATLAKFSKYCYSVTEILSSGGLSS